MRSEAKARLEAVGDEFDQRDFDKLMTDDFYVGRFWIHSFFIPGERTENTVNLITNTFRWRKQFGVNDIREVELAPDLLQRGSLFSRGRDRDGCKLFIFSIRKHVKEPDRVEEMKRLLVYMLERLEREEKGRMITIVFDSHSAGLGNFDLDLVRFLIQALIGFYPNLISKILVYEMPWILNAAWKVIRSLLPPPAVARIKFVSKATVKQVVAEHELLVEWGGQDAWQYNWQPEQLVQQAEQLQQAEEKEMQAGCKYQLFPSQTIKFSPGPSGPDTLQAELRIQNPSTEFLAYKVKTTRPGLFVVRPHSGLVEPGGAARVSLQAERGWEAVAAQRFQLNLAHSTTRLTGPELAALLARPAASPVLKCEAAGGGGEKESRDSAWMRERLNTMEDKLYFLYQVLALQAVLLLGLALYRVCL